MAASHSIASTPVKLFENAPPVPESPTLDRETVNEMLENLHKELEDKYQKQFEELMKIIESLKGGAPNLNTIKYAENNPEIKVEKLKPIDAKDLKKPEEFDGNKDFHVWFERFKDLLTNRNRDLLIVFEMIEHAAVSPDKIVHEDFVCKISEKFGETQSNELGEQYALQLRSYLRSYSKGQFYDKVTKTDAADVFELMRDTIKKGQNRNPYRMVAMKAELLSPQQAKSVKDLELVLTEWKHKYGEVRRYDPKFELNEDTKKTLLMKIIFRDFAKVMRENFDKHHDFDSLETQLYTEIATRQMEEDHYGKGKNIQAVVEDAARDAAYMAELDAYNQYYYQDDQVWDPWINAIAPKRDREEEDEDADGRKRLREEKGKGKGNGKKGSRGPRAPVNGACWTCGGPHFQVDCPNKGKGKGPVPSAWTSWRPPVYPGPSPAQWRAWIPKYGMKGMKGAKGKEKGGKGDGAAGKGVGAMWWQFPPLGNISYAGQAEQSDWTSQNGFQPICAVLKTSKEEHRFKPIYAVAKKPVKLNNMFDLLREPIDDIEDKDVNAVEDKFEDKSKEKTATCNFKSVPNSDAKQDKMLRKQRRVHFEELGRTAVGRLPCIVQTHEKQ